MGTNYYVTPQCANPCPHCSLGETHLGKASWGWAFSFRAYCSNAVDGIDWPVQDWDSWLRMLDLGKITNEYGDTLTKDEMLALVESHRGLENTLYGDDWLDEHGNRFCPREFS